MERHQQNQREEEFLTAIANTLAGIIELKQAEQWLKEREKELEIKSSNLEEANTALKVLLKRRDEDKTELEEKILFNVKELVAPYLEKLKKSGREHCFAVWTQFVFRISEPYSCTDPSGKSCEAGQNHQRDSRPVECVPQDD
jgi:hypothetical protein